MGLRGSSVGRFTSETTFERQLAQGDHQITCGAIQTISARLQTIRIGI